MAAAARRARESGAAPGRERPEPLLANEGPRREHQQLARAEPGPNGANRLRSWREARRQPADLGTRTLIARSGDVTTRPGDPGTRKAFDHPPGAAPPALRKADGGRTGSWLVSRRREQPRDWRAEPLLVGAVVGAAIVVILGSVAAGLALSSGPSPGVPAVNDGRPSVTIRARQGSGPRKPV